MIGPMDRTVHPTEQIPSALPGMRWPALPAAAGAAVMSLSGVLDATESWQDEQLLEGQQRQLSALLRHACAHVPYYRKLDSTIQTADGLEFEERWRELPLLTREQIQEQFKDLTSEYVPADHGTVRKVHTSGSTGAPLAVLESQLCQLWFKAMHVREYAWHGVDLRQRFASIRPLLSGAEEDMNAAAAVASGPYLNIRTPMAEQLAWVLKERPAYLQSFPTNLEALATHARSVGVDLSFLQSTHTYGEALRPETRTLCEDVFGCRLVDMYSAVELGVIALQNPGDDDYLACAETHLVEVLRDDGQPCAPGEVGRVVITALHNYAMPLIRFANGDYAEAGAGGGGGFGRPVLRRVMGRERNMLVGPRGERLWLTLAPDLFGDYENLVRFQIVQRKVDALEVRLVLRGDAAPGAEAAALAKLTGRLPAPYRIELNYCERIDPLPSGKYEDFLCLVGAPR